MSEKYLSFAVTYRSYGGVTDTEIHEFMKVVRNVSLYYYVITEKSDEKRHIHAALYLKTEALPSTFNQKFKRVLSRHCNDQTDLKVAYVGKPMYNSDFLDKYLAKGDDTVVIQKCLPEAATLESYYKNIKRKRKAVTDHFYDKLEMLWYEHRSTISNPTLHELSEFLGDMMYDARKIRVISDPRRCKSIIYSLRNYLTRHHDVPFHSNTTLIDPDVNWSNGTQ